MMCFAIELTLTTIIWTGIVVCFTTKAGHVKVFYILTGTLSNYRACLKPCCCFARLRQEGLKRLDEDTELPLSIHTMTYFSLTCSNRK